MKKSKQEITGFYKAPRYIFRKLNVLSLLNSISDINTFLDVGSGAGELACTLAKKDYIGTGVDFSKDAIVVANNIKKEYGVPENNLNFKLGGLEKVKGNKFDLVMCFEVLEHVEDDHSLLKELVEYSNKYLLISVPAKQKLFDDWDVMAGHFRRYEKSSLITLLESTNLEVVKFINYGFPITDAVRILRRASASEKLKEGSMKKRTKGSGINPVKPPSIFYKIDIENIVKPFYWFSRLFNKHDFSEGYLVLCKKV